MRPQLSLTALVVTFVAVVAAWTAVLVADAEEDGRVIAVSVGLDHTCVLRAEGAVVCWGANDAGQANAIAGRYVSVSAGARYTCALRQDAEVVCWGANELGQANAPKGRYLLVSAGGGHTCALRQDRTLICWGANELGQTDAPDGEYLSVSAGGYHTCALRVDDTVLCWGDGRDGQTVASPFRVEAPREEDSRRYSENDEWYVPSSISAGAYHTCVGSADAWITCWGSPWSVVNVPQHGIDWWGEPTPLGAQIHHITSGGLHACAMTGDGDFFCWGENSNDQIDAPEGHYTKVDAGFRHSCALRRDDTVVCWGDPKYGLATELPGQYIEVDDNGDELACAELHDGVVICWGPRRELYPNTMGTSRSGLKLVNRAWENRSSFQIVAQRLPDGRTEFGALSDNGELLLPKHRHLPADPPVGSWLQSSKVHFSGAPVGWITARAVADGRIEFGFLTVDRERISPDLRFLSSSATVGRWLRSSTVELP